MCKNYWPFSCPCMHIHVYMYSVYIHAQITLYMYVHMELTDTMAMVNTLREQLDTSGSSHIPPLPHTRLASPGEIQKSVQNA